MPLLEQPLTSLDAYLELFRDVGEGPQYEVVDGQPVVSPSPGGAHQRCLRALLLLLHESCPPGHEVMVAPWDWVLRELPRLTVRQPDLVVVRSDLAAAPRLTTAPLLAVEVLSEGSFERDAVTKRSEYAEAGLDDYWVVDPATAEVFVHRRLDGQLRLWRSLPASTPHSLDTPFPVTLHLEVGAD